MVWFSPLCHLLNVTPMIETHDCDDSISQLPRSLSYKYSAFMSSAITQLKQTPNSLSFPWRFYDLFFIMADNLRRGIQNLVLGADDPPVQLPEYVINEAVAENRFILIGRPVMPRRQNIRAIIANLPRSWGHEGVQGRLVEGRRFQFVFPTEEALEMVMRRGPWAFADRMLVMERWTPLFNPLMLNFIPFWVQIRGIPFQYMSQDVVIHIGRALGMYMEVDYNSEVTARREFARVRINWNVDEPLRFQKHFQFTAGVNTLLRFTYERLRGFCEVCGMLTHDSGACLIQNGGMGNDDDGGNSEDDNPEEERANVPGIIIEEITEEEQQEHDANGQEVREENNPVDESGDQEEDLDAELWYAPANPTMSSEDFNMTEMYNPVSVHGERNDSRESLKRKSWMEDANSNVGKFSNMEVGETSCRQYTRRKKCESLQDDVEKESVTTSEAKDGTSTVRGAVDPEPPLPP